VKLISPASGFIRNAATSEQGGFSFPVLLAGEYEVSIEASGFRALAVSSDESGTVYAGTPGGVFRALHKQ
jgi:hypothetical protein